MKLKMDKRFIKLSRILKNNFSEYFNINAEIVVTKVMMNRLINSRIRSTELGKNSKTRSTNLKKKMKQSQWKMLIG